MWNKFINGYCKVDFLCFNNEPNWLGWIPLIGVSVVFFILFFSALIRLSEAEKRDQISRELYK